MADILAAHWPAYVAKFGRLIPPEQHAAVRAILRCRTPALGGMIYRCACGPVEFAYHSCNHRACPRCGQDDAATWLAQQRTRLLPVPYFLVTFTLPEQLREPIRAAMKVWYGALLKESAGAVQDLAIQSKYLGAELGLTAMLQTWTRDQRFHPHVHLLVPTGGLSPDHLRWVRAKDPEFFLPWRKLQARFKGRLKAWLKEHAPELLAKAPDKVWWMTWNVDLQAVGNGEAALKYLANYLCKPPIHESQINHWDANSVTFSYRDNAGNPHTDTVTGEEFLRRFLQHVLPKGFQRVRHYGWRAAAAKAKWERLVALLDLRAPELVPPPPRPLPKCPTCGKSMFLCGTFPRAPT